MTTKEQPANRLRSQNRGGRLVAGTSAALFGVLGWLTAHAVTAWLAEHTTHAHDGGPVHRHPQLLAAILTVACLAGGSLIAVFAAAVPGGPATRPVLRRTRRAAARRSSLLSTAAFVLAEFAEHAVTGSHETPPLAILATGGVVHALLGAASSLLWRHVVAGVLRLAGLLHGGVPTANPHRIPLAIELSSSARRTWRAVALAGRAPPSLRTLASR